MEGVGLAVSLVSLVTVFQTAVDCFECVQVANDFGNDFQTSCLRLDNAQLQLTRWGEAVGLENEPDKVTTLNDRVPSKDVKQAEALLGQIISLFERARAASSQFGNRSGDSFVADPSEMLNPSNLSLHERMKAICLRRQKSSSKGKQAKWALYKKAHLKELVCDIRDLVDDLVKLFPTTLPAQEQLCREEAAELEDESSLPELRNVIAEQDKLLEQAISTLVSASSRTAQNTFNFNNRDNTKIVSQGNNEIAHQVNHL